MEKSFFTTLTIEKKIEVGLNYIDEIKLFNENKLIILGSDKILVYDLLKEKFILNLPLVNNLYFSKIEIIGKDKLIIGILKEMKNHFIIYQFLEDKLNNKYNLIILSETSLSNYEFQFCMLKFLFVNDKIIIIGNNSIYIYEYKNNSPILLTRIRNNQYNNWIDGFIFNKEIIGLLEGNNNLVHFYKMKKGKLIQQNILTANIKISNWTSLNLNDNDQILFGMNNTILLYSFKKNKVLQKIEDKYYINCLALKDNKIFCVGPYINNIYLNKQKIDRITFYQSELIKKHYERKNNLIFYQNKIIYNSKDRIIIFNNSLKRTLLEYIKNFIYYILKTIVLGLIIIYALSFLIFCILLIIFIFIIIIYFFGYIDYYKKIEIYMEKYNSNSLTVIIYLCWFLYFILFYILLALFCYFFDNK